MNRRNLIKGAIAAAVAPSVASEVAKPMRVYVDISAPTCFVNHTAAAQIGRVVSYDMQPNAIKASCVFFNGLSDALRISDEQVADDFGCTNQAFNEST